MVLTVSKKRTKMKTYTEEEIFKKIEEYQYELGLLEESSINTTDWDRDAFDLLEKLKQKFMTAQGFSKAIDKAGLRGKKF